MRRLLPMQPEWLREVFELRARKGIDPRGRVLVEGLRLVAAARSAKLAFDGVVYAPEFFAGEPCKQQLEALQRDGVRTTNVSSREFSKLSYKAEGLVGVVRYTAPSLLDVLRSPRVLVLDGLSDPGNIGAVLRTANAWGPAGVVVVGRIGESMRLSARGPARLDDPNGDRNRWVVQRRWASRRLGEG